MKNMKKILCLALAVALVAVISVGLTVAYLTDRDSKANVFTIGDVDIVLNESFGQGTALVPGVDIEKVPTITNIGKNTAWVWAHVAIPAALDSEYAYNNVVHFNYDKNSVGTDMWSWMKKDQPGWNMFTTTIEGMEYNVYTVVYQKPLTVGATTESLLAKVYMDHNVDITPEGDMYIVENGITTPVGWNVHEDAFPIIYVSAYAVQVEGFDTVWDAHDAYFTQWGTNGIKWAPAGIPVYTEEDLLKAFERGGPYVLQSDIVRTGTETVVTADLTLDMNGFSIISDRNHESGKKYTVPEITTLTVDGCKLTLKGKGEVKNIAPTAAYAIAVSNGGEVIIDGPILVESYHDAFYVAEGTLTLLNGHFVSREDKDGSADDGATASCVNCHRATVINCSDNGYVTGVVTVNVKGGTFVNYNPASVHEGWSHHQNLVADGYKIIEETQSNGDIWYIVIPE